MGGGRSSFQPFSIYKCKVVSLSNHFSLRALPLLSGTAAMLFILKGETADGEGLVVWRQSVNQPFCPSVNKSLFISVGAELSVRCLEHVVSLPAIPPLAPSYMQLSHQLFLRHSSDPVELLLKHSWWLPMSSRKKKSTEFDLTCWGALL